MSSIILQAHSLTKKYRHTVALDHIDLQIEKGKIYGFIGQNGAGKTTFLRLVTGLAFQTSGTLDLWGKSSAKDLQEQRKRIGCMIETPALFPAMTAYQNMEIQRIQRGIPDKAVIEKTLNMVGLKDTGKKSVRNFSLGMRQRLGIAIALLNTPEFLILDEPINGLDPAGIVEVRNLLKSLNKEYGMTILVSSHILEELYQTATEFILIDKGKIIEEISDQELNERCKRHIAIKATDPQKALLVLEEKLHTENFKLMPDGTIRLYDYLDDLEKVAAVLSDAHTIFAVLVSLFAMCLLPFFFAFLFRDIGKTLAVPMVLFFLMIFLMNGDQALFISRILPMGQLRLIALQQFIPSMVQFVFTDFLWIFILYFGAYLGFRHSDLK